MDRLRQRSSTVRALEAISTPSLTILSFSPGAYIYAIIAPGSVGENRKIISDNLTQIFTEARVMFYFSDFYERALVTVVLY